MKSNEIKVDDKVSYTDQHGKREGVVIETNYNEKGEILSREKHKRARIKWGHKNLRTWVRISSLVKLACLLLFLASCQKSAPVQTVRFHIIYRCLDELPANQWQSGRDLPGLPGNHINYPLPVYPDSLGLPPKQLLNRCKTFRADTLYY